ncbi:MAG: hypothetical protein IKB13_01690 [Clostridia bacterium]|nr:hypothetical protein [Clostridia bacterium]
MKTFLTKLHEKLPEILVYLLLPIAAPIVLILMGVVSVKEHLKYKKTRYYRDTHERFTVLGGATTHIAFYNAIKESDLPVAFYRDKTAKAAGYGYFLYDDVLILCDYDSDICFFDKEKGEWMVHCARDYRLLATEVDEQLQKANAFFGTDKCKRAVVLMEKSVLDAADTKQYVNFEFLPVVNGDMAAAVKNYIM